MLPLESPRWSQLQHAYGNASDTPGLLRRLAGVPTGPEAATIWNQLYSSVLHQGDIHTSAFAVVPHLVEIAQRVAPKARLDFIHFIGAVATNGYPPDGAEDLWRDSLGAFAAANEWIDPLFAELENTHELLTVASARAAFEGCSGTAQMIMDRAEGFMELDCPIDECGVTIEIEFADGRGIAAACGKQTDLTALVPPPFDPDEDWSEADALVRLCAQLTASGRPEPATVLASMDSSVTCPECSSTFALNSVLEPLEE